MTFDDIERAAIEAAAKEAVVIAVKLAGGDVAQFEDSWGAEKQEDKDKLLTCVRAAIRAYEREMWRPVEEASHGETVILWSPGKEIEMRPYSTGRSSPSGSSMSYHAWATHFRSLPKREG